jgi:2-oxoglutarate ferredoxin oxidoreductase subunit gamma
LKPLSVRISGFGGQGIILTSIILGTAAVTKRNLYVVQTQSYGSEARGGQCQAELIISEQPIRSPSTKTKDILVSLFQGALDRYISTLKPDGILIIDPKLVNKIPTQNYTVYRVPATETAIQIGNRIVANMVMLGFLQPLINLISEYDLKSVITDTVKEKFVDINLNAFNAGLNIAKVLKPIRRT